MPDTFYKVSSDQLNLSLDTYNPNDGNSLRYPEGLSQAGIPFVLFAPYMRDRSVSITDDNGDSLVAESPPVNWTTALPIPSSALKTAYSVKYEDKSLGTVAGTLIGNKGAIAGTAAAAAVAIPIIAATATGAAILTGGLTLIRSVGFLNAARVLAGAGSLAGGAAALVPKDAPALMSQQKTNPFTEVLFDSIPFRTHTFDYTFYPRNVKESETLDRILQRFKFYMLPRIGGRMGGGSTTIDFPYEWQIYYSINNTTFTLLPSVLESFLVDYGGETDSPKLFAPTIDNKRYPSKITVQMKFKETFLLYRNLLNVETEIGSLPYNGISPTREGVPIPDPEKDERPYFFAATYRL